MGINKRQQGFTLVELIVTMVIFSIVAMSTYTLLVGYISSSAFAQMKATAVGIATSKIESLRALPYNSLAVQGGAIIISGTYLPSQEEVTRSSRTFTVTTDIRYVDDAYDGCFSYSSTEQRDRYCVNGPPDASKPVDTNPRDYKVAQVTVKDKASGQVLASRSSYFASRVAEVASDTAIISVKVTDSSGTGVSGATVHLQNSATSPTVDQTITTDDEGSALFSDIVPDNNPDYVITASKTGYSTLSTIAASGSLIPTYPNVSAIAQHMTNATLTIDSVSSSSLDLQVVNTSGSYLVGVTATIKGGIKLYTDTNDTQYSYNQSLTTGSSGYITLQNLVPGKYTIQSVSSGEIVAVHTATGSSTFQPFDILPGATPPAGLSSMQSVLVITSTNFSYPAISSLTPTSVSSTDPNASDILVTVHGSNLNGATVTLVGRLSGTTLTGIVTETADQNDIIVRSFDIRGAPEEAYRLQVSTAAGTAIQDSRDPSAVGAFSVGP